MAAGVHHRHRLPLTVDSPDLAGVGQAGRLLDRQGVHIGAQHDGRSLAVAEQADDAGLPDPRRHLVAGAAELVRRQAGRPRLLHRQLGVRVYVGVKRLQVREQAIEVFKHRVGRTRLGRAHSV